MTDESPVPDTASTLMRWWWWMKASNPQCYETVSSQTSIAYSSRPSPRFPSIKFIFMYIFIVCRVDCRLLGGCLYADREELRARRCGSTLEVAIKQFVYKMCCIMPHMDHARIRDHQKTSSVVFILSTCLILRRECIFPGNIAGRVIRERMQRRRSYFVMHRIV